MYLNKYFELIYCINLSIRKDRWIQAQAEFEKHNIKAIRVSAINTLAVAPANNEIGFGARGCALSHIKVLERFLRSGKNRCLILEDDVEFVDNIQNKFENSLKFIPTNWDMLYLGGHHNGSLILHNGPIYRTSSTYTTSSYGITRETAQKMLLHINKLHAPIDIMYSEMLPKHKAYTFHPGLARQRPGYSDIESCNVWYDEYFQNSLW